MCAVCKVYVVCVWCVRFMLCVCGVVSGVSLADSVCVASVSCFHGY